MRNSTRLFSALALTAAVAACSGEDVPRAMGTVSLDLVGQAPSGNVYRLRNALIIVQGPFTTTFWSTEDDPDRTSLSEEVPTGFYSAFVQEGWRLEFLDPAGPATPVDAELISHNPISFDVFEGERTRVALRFRVGDDEVNFETGYDIVIDVDEVSPPPRICAADEACAAGETCCLAGLLGSCVALAPGASCPLPDLTISAESGSPFVTFQSFEPDSCAIADGCVLAPGERRLLNFSSRVPNVGAADLLMGDPTTTPGFTFSECRGQFQFDDHALYEVIDGAGTVVASGRRSASCVRAPAIIRLYA